MFAMHRAERRQSTTPTKTGRREAEMKMNECEANFVCFLHFHSHFRIAATLPRLFPAGLGGQSFCTSNSSLAAIESRTFSVLPLPFVFIFPAFRLILPLLLLLRFLERSGWNRLVDTLFT